MSHRTMDWLMPLGCILLWVGLVLAEVGSFSGCYKYFYQDAEPCGFATANTTKICQRYSNLYHFATLYDRPQRIPRWSAYTLGDPNCPEQARKMSQWFVEPQVSPKMTTEAESTLSLDERRSSQAISKDYEDMSYDRGHLNPNAFQCNVGRTVTFTLTNTAPMNPYFNQVHWSKLEKTLKAQLTGSCRNVGGKPYLVTGAVPRDRNRPYNRVSVPSHVWTAVCCDHADNNRKFSFAFIGENKEASSLQIIPVEQLNTELLHLYKTPGPQQDRLLVFCCPKQKNKQTNTECRHRRRCCPQRTGMLPLEKCCPKYMLRMLVPALGPVTTTLCSVTPPAEQASGGTSAGSD
uniref:Endonuclease domain-containing 1 protein-like n=1 Tax=Chelonoidis abingdonii TaxID=106734 RepID=A0A8C0H4G4_CHEAB